MLPSVPAPLADGTYVGSTPPLPVYVTNAMLESEATSTPVIAVAVTPVRALLTTGFATNVSPASGQAPVGTPGIAGPPGDSGGLEIARSVNVAAGVTVAPRICSPSFVAAIRSVTGPLTPASG